MNPIVVVMGVSGSGKTTVARRLAMRRGWTFLEADDLHPEANVAKMRAGSGLSDADRAPWIAALAARLDALHRTRDGVAVACSALRHAHRQTLRVGPRVVFVHLHVDAETLRTRLAERSEHYAGPDLLPSQLATFEAPTPEEAIRVDGGGDPGSVVDAIERALES